jgi:cation diffusion facilitator CzcD-associated flavoprotein CzcO
MVSQGLEKYCKTNHLVVGAQWDESCSKWKVQVNDVNTGRIIHDHCDIFINGSGVLNNWRWPAIPGIEKYRGSLLHSANWDPNLDLTGKIVGLIGNGWV